MLEARELACVRGERGAVFAGLSFRLEAGGALLVTGPNGAGKSTLLRVLAGLLPAAAGQVLWRGEDIAADRAAHARRLRYVGHQDGLKPGLTVRENLAFYARLWGGGTAPALEAMGLAPLAGLPARMLSAGQRRRLALARLALGAPPGAGGAALWLLDEPTTGLDAASVARLARLLERHRAQGGLVVAATHLPLPLPDAAELRL
ncbi:heme ABC exporter ATP-binding protein CcmA [Caldovatus aquaticus]|uniref:Heme ABC exporter ATP-binding protein CcmA n=1 Tax=Caldovatus aquaticus TaxID=2865671 RepID=A0ABS7F5J1_9PROT|nr:heme ABC exporter ATP-binding protein CcmA [Caldovatus aquaticus]MBW8270881.1 heme ABC exporter ATP-binding protein CcmA [Caldovatus aquaticus]